MAYVSQPGQACSPVCLVQLHDPLLQLPGLVWGEAELADIVAHVLLGIMVTQFSLHGVGAQQGVRDEGARQAARDDVCPQLQAQVVPGDREQGGHWLYLPGGPDLGYWNQVKSAHWKMAPTDTYISWLMSGCVLGTGFETCHLCSFLNFEEYFFLFEENL